MHNRFAWRWTAGAVLVAVALVVACRGGSRPEKFKQKLIVLGFDGLDPALVERWVAAGHLPNFARLIKEGGIYPLETTVSPESPTSWSSFATGANPGRHNIYDFLVRDTSNYLIDLGMVRREPARFLFNYIPIRKPKVESIRGGTSFWVTAGRAGVRSSVLTVPVTFPPEEVPNGEMLSGLPLPDIRGTMGTFSYYATDLSRYEEGNTEMGGILRRLAMEGDIAHAELEGPPNPVIRQQMQQLRVKARNMTPEERAKLADLEAQQDVRLPMTIHWNRSTPERSATIEIAGQSIMLRQGEWSRWINLDFRVNFLLRVHGMAQFYLVNAGDELQLYVSPINWKPDSPPMPMSYPDSFAGDLYERLGPYRTLGWAEATWPLNEGRMDDKTFMDDLYRAFDDRAQVILSRIDARNWDLMVGVIESTDRVQHMFWRYMDPRHPLYDAAGAAKFGDSIERVYRRADQFVGEVLEHIDPGTPILIVSDHGFHSWRKSVNLNTWLVQNGYMVLQGQKAGDKNLNDLFGGGGEFWENVDWSRTRAYAMGIGQIYFNLKGREAHGIVSAGAEYKQLSDELGARLRTMQDPEDGTPIIRNVYKRDDWYKGEFLQNASDLQVGMEDGYRVSWQTCLGGAPQGIVYPNDRKWSGDHGGYDWQTTAGVLISSRKLPPGRRASIMDIAPTVLKFFGIAVPGEMDGKALF